MNIEIVFSHSYIAGEKRDCLKSEENVIYKDKTYFFSNNYETTPEMKLWLIYSSLCHTFVRHVADS